MDYREAARQIGKGRVQPVYVLYGTEIYLMREFISYLTDQWVGREDREFAVSRFDLSETNVEAVVDDALTPPFFGSRKLIVAGDADFFTAAKSSSGIDHHTDRLAEYLESPAEFSVIVFTVRADKLDERKKLVKGIKQLGGLVPFPPLDADELAQWVRRQADRLGFALEEGAEQAIIMSCGANLQAIAGEMEKLALFAGPQGKVGKADVERMVAQSTEQNVFVMIDELVNLRVDRALELFHELLRRKEDPAKITALMARQFRNMLLIKRLAEQGFSQQQIAARLSLHPYAVKVGAGQARRFHADKLRAIIRELAEADYRMKTGQIDKVLALELFMLGLAG